MASTSAAYQFYFNNPVMYPGHYASIALEGLEISFQSQIEITDVYDYFKISSSANSQAGFGSIINRRLHQAVSTRWM